MFLGARLLERVAVIDDGKKIEPTAAQRAVLARWRLKLGPRAFGELLRSMAPALEYINREHAFNEAHRATSEGRIARAPVKVPIMPNETAALFFDELCKATRESVFDRGNVRQ